MKTILDQTKCKGLACALGKEWLETNGLGGYASSTIIGANTRRHHGLLVAALKPPGARRVLLSKFEESVLVAGHEAFISTNVYPGTVFPHGFNIQKEFRLRPWPTFCYVCDDFEVEKFVLMAQGEHTVVVGYRNLRSRGPLQLKLRPLLAFRDYNDLKRRDDKADGTVERAGDVVSVQPYRDLPRLYFHARAESVRPNPDWYLRFTYPVEQERGMEFEEDLFTPFEMMLRVPAGETTYVVVSLDRKNGARPEELVVREAQRRKPLARESDSRLGALTIAADSFVARRGDDGLTVLAGFPWFTDWGRDTMVALPGLTLSTRHFEQARRILATYARCCDKGLLPNSFSDNGAAEYNTVDAALWFAVAVWRYWKASDDADGTAEFLPVLRGILKAYRDGTRFDIRADSDGLIVAGGPGSQLTWMDVKVDGYVPTPRHGKPVEVNALWLNALLMLAEMEEKLARDIHSAVILRKLADQVAGSFMKTFWNAAGGCLFDVVQGDTRDASIRPNQILAVSLPHSPLDRAQQQSVFDVVTRELLTPYGLRTLSPKHEKYCGQYTGNRWQRDCALHQGTVWPWLIGPYCDALVKLSGPGKNSRKEIAKLLEPLFAHLEEAGLGYISEIFDGDPPHRPGGCFAQAWSVAEVLRVYDAYAR
jgi:predicted glycogen debranching enzyme